MNQSLSTAVKTHVIVTHSGSAHFITSEQNDRLADVGLDDLMELDNGEKIKGSSIAEVLTIAKYYETYPNRMPQNYGQPPSNVDYPDTRNGKGMAERMSEYYEKNPDKKNSRGYKFFQEHIKGFRKN
jgi:hypothetical protein